MLFCDSADHYTTLAHKWTSSQNASVRSGGGRGGTNSAALNQWGGVSYLYKVLPVSSSTLITGLAIHFPILMSSNPSGIISYADLSAGGSLQCELRLQTNGRLVVTRNGTQLGSQGSTVLATNTWYYIEFKVTFHNSTGAATARINGVDEIVLTGQDTQTTANATADSIQLGGLAGVSAFTDIDFDDIVVCNSTGSTNNDFLGDVTVEARLPNGNGNSSQFDGSDGNSVDNYLLVDETAPNSDTDYVTSPDVGDKDTYAYQNLTTTTGTVYGIQVLPFMRKATAGSRTAVSVARLSATETDGPVTSISDSYRYYPDIRETKPGGGAWAIADVNNAEFGIKVDS